MENEIINVTSDAQEVVEVLPENVIPEAEQVLTQYDPATGTQTVVEGSSEEMMHKLSDAHYKAFTEDDSVDDDTLHKILSNVEMDGVGDYFKIADVIKKRMRNESFDYYGDLPDQIKKEVDAIFMSTAMTYRGKNPPSRGTIAKKVIDELIASYKQNTFEGELDLDTMLNNFNNEIIEHQQGAAKDFGNLLMSFDDDRKDKIDAAIKRCEADNKPEAVEKLKVIKDTLSEAFTLESFADYCTNDCKIKSFDFKKPNKVYDLVNVKYINHKNTINDIASCPDILDRHLPNYTHDQKTALCFAFCKYCRNMSPDDVKDHTFMYYFIRNIILFDRVNPKGECYNSMNEKCKSFYDTFSANLSKCMDGLISRNDELLSTHDNI